MVGEAEHCITSFLAFHEQVGRFVRYGTALQAFYPSTRRSDGSCGKALPYKLSTLPQGGRTVRAVWFRFTSFLPFHKGVGRFVRYGSDIKAFYPSTSRSNGSCGMALI